MKETVTMPTARVYLDNLRKLLADNSLITEAWFDHPDHPTSAALTRVIRFFEQRLLEG